MNEKLRKSGIDTIGDLPWGAHFCQFYRTKEDLTEILVPYFKAGLENNEFCMLITSQPMEVEEAKESLEKAIPDFDVYMEKGQIEIIPYTYWCAKEGFFDSEMTLNGLVEKLNQALAGNYDGLRLGSNPFWLEKEAWDNFVDYEKKVDLLVSNYPIITLCTYSLDSHDVTETVFIVSNHQFSLVKKKGKWERIENIGRENTTGHEWAKDKLLHGEQCFSLEPESTLSLQRRK